jgi:hypothetical protein
MVIGRVARKLHASHATICRRCSGGQAVMPGTLAPAGDAIGRHDLAAQHFA